MGNLPVARLQANVKVETLSSFPELQVQEWIASYKLFKVIHCTHAKHGSVVVKVFPYRSLLSDSTFRILAKALHKLRERLSRTYATPNVLCYQELLSEDSEDSKKIQQVLQEDGTEAPKTLRQEGETMMESQRPGGLIVMRPYYKRSLYERLYTRPFLSRKEKRWLAFQFLHGLVQLHLSQVPHLDLKCENVFVLSGSFQLTITDIAFPFKPVYLPEDNPAEFNFFFQSDQRKRCYLAPERVISKTDVGPRNEDIFLKSITKITEKDEGVNQLRQTMLRMDVFSAGCVLAELFLDGKALIHDLPDLLRYRKCTEKRDPVLEERIEKINDDVVRELVREMISLDPWERPTALECFKRFYCQGAHEVLLNISTISLHPIFQQADMRLLLLHHNLSGVFDQIFGKEAFMRTEVSKLQLPAVRPVILSNAVNAALKRFPYLMDAFSYLQRRQEEDEQDMMMANNNNAAASSATSSSYAVKWALPTIDFNRPTLENLMKHYQDEYFFIDSSGKGPAFFKQQLGCASAMGDDDEFVSAGEYSMQLPPSKEYSVSNEEIDVGQLCVVLISLVESALPCTSSPRIRLLGLNMLGVFIQVDYLTCLYRTMKKRKLQKEAHLQQQHSLLEHAIPTLHFFMLDQAPSVQACAISNLMNALEKCLPEYDESRMQQIFQQVEGENSHFSDDVKDALIDLHYGNNHHLELFIEYLLPQFFPVIHGEEPVVQMAVGEVLGRLTEWAMRQRTSKRASEQQQQFMPNLEENLNPSDPDASDATADASNKPNDSGAEEVDDKFDTATRPLLIEGYQKLIKTLLGHASETGNNSGGNQYLTSSVVSRELKIAILKCLPTLSILFGREGVHNFLLPHLISFMNDPACEVRAAFCQEVGRVSACLGRVSVEGLLWPCYEQCLFDPEERVVLAALKGARAILSGANLSRTWRYTVMHKTVLPLLVHPHEKIREAAHQLVCAAVDTDVVDFHAFWLPLLEKFLKKNVVLRAPKELEDIDILIDSVSRQTYTTLIQTCLKDQSSRQALLDGEEYSEDVFGAEETRALELLRPLLVSLLKKSAHEKTRHPQPDVHMIRVTSHPVWHVEVNPQVPSARSLEVRCEMMMFDSPNGEVPIRTPKSFFCSPPTITNSGTASEPRLLVSDWRVEALGLPRLLLNMGTLRDAEGLAKNLYRSVPGGPYGAAVSPRGVARDDVSPGLPGIAAAGIAAANEFLNDESPAGGAAAASTQLGAPPARDGLFHGGGAGAGGAKSSNNFPNAPDKTRWEGKLLATLYDYDGVSNVLVDPSDDGRILVTAGNRCIKMWSGSAIEKEVSVKPYESLLTNFRIRCLKLLANTKSVCTAGDSDNIEVWRMDRGAVKVSSVKVDGALKIMCVDHCDTTLDSLVCFATETGALCGWDVRCPNRLAWSCEQAMPSSLGLPCSMSCAMSSNFVTVGSIGGGMSLFDLRFLCPIRTWRLNSGVPLLQTKMRGKSEAVCALGSEGNQVCVFDVVRGETLGLFESRSSTGAPVHVPTLNDVRKQGPATSTTAGTSASSSVTPDGVGSAIKHVFHKGQNVCRSLLLLNDGRDVLMGGSDRKVRYWQDMLAPKEPNIRIVTPTVAENNYRESYSYSYDRVENMYLAQERCIRGDPLYPIPPVGRNQTAEDVLMRPGPLEANPNHRDAILDMAILKLQEEILVTCGRDGLVKIWK